MGGEGNKEKKMTRRREVPISDQGRLSKKGERGRRGKKEMTSHLNLIFVHVGRRSEDGSTQVYSMLKVYWDS